MELEFKGACREVGRSAVLIDEKIMMDYGVSPGEHIKYPVNGSRPEAILVSHAHIDHSGAVPNLMDLEPDVYMTPPTFDLAHMLAKDTLKIAEREGEMPAYDSIELSKFAHQTKQIDTGVEFHAHGYDLEFFNAGHIPGAAAIHVKDKENKSLFYTGDINTSDTRLVSGAVEFPDADVLITESTYFGDEHPPRKEVEKAFIDSVFDTLNIGGSVIVPAFAIGRTQELLMLLDAHGIRPFVDGMGVQAYKIMSKHPEYIRNPTHLKRAFDNATMVAGRKRDGLRLESSVVVTTAGMLNGGPVLRYISRLYKDPKSKIILSGYQVEGTNGRMALDTGNIENDGVIQHLKPKIEQYDFSAHSGDKELKQMVKDFCDRGTQRVFTMHGDNCEGFADWIKEEIGVEACAPELGERFTI
ncbi:MBL fold metallo-hydrolase [Methanolobus profundi]|uniref:Putative mRNA 3-end processing factor n=1 Tax=Methanolobus profundi TaxID=487685 RepID=A0A1I4S3C4_9EURY|nr:MBL fold metallo-hydrolase [Methanolobus profundi]SFM58804.1 putative mRNA 3-end processing factor [Methanolobus profundi]